MPIDFKLKDSARVALALSAVFPLGAYAAGAGRVDFAIGNVTALAADGRARALTKGADINSGETITTGDGRAQLRFTDGAQVSLTPGTQYRIDDYRYDGNSDGNERSFFSLLKGGFRTITGLVGKTNKQAYRVNTSTATIGIRGTEFVVLSDENGVTISTGEGAVEVCTSAGCIVLASGESAVVRDKDGMPVRITNAGADSTNSKPATPSVKIDYTKNDEGLPAITGASLTSGPGYAMATAGVLDGGESGFSVRYASGTATFNGASELTNYVSDGAEGYQSVTMGGGFTDGTIGWGRWATGTRDVFGPEAGIDMHYVVGKPTRLTEMDALSFANTLGTYTLLGSTTASSTLESTGATTLATGSVAGTLTADFGGGSVAYSLSNINFTASGGSNYSISGNATISGALFSGGGGTATGGVSTSGVTVQGLFAGANAARAGLVYQFLESDGGNRRITGAATFTQTGLVPGGGSGGY